jgi:hypothetical protein
MILKLTFMIDFIFAAEIDPQTPAISPTTDRVGGNASSYLR